MRKTVFFAILLAFCGTGLFAQLPKPLAVGDKAPDFSLPYGTKDSVGDGLYSLSGMAGKKIIILAFYPADWSGGCTKEMCTMRDNFSDLAKLNALVLGVSGDYEYSHHEWAKFHSLPFPLLSDHSHAVAKQYASYGENGFNRRTVYLIDKSGKIAYIDLEYKTRDQASFLKLAEAVHKIQ
jgi:peroxiredoxin Q/BCP